MAEIDCSVWRSRCEFLSHAARHGIDNDRLREMGIEPGSERARLLEDGLYRVFQHCCTLDYGRIDPVEEPPPETVEAGMPPAAAAVALGTAAPLLTEAEIAFLTRAMRFGLAGLVLYVANAIARRAGYQICPLTQVRLHPFGDLSFVTCNYYCGDRWYKLANYAFGLDCPKFIVVPV